MTAAGPAAAAPVARAERARIASTLAYPRRPDWVSRVDVLYQPGTSWARLVRRLAGRASSGYELMILDGSNAHPLSPELAAAMLIARRRRNRTPVILTECNWKPGTGIEHLARVAGMKAIDRAVARYCVYTTDELQDFPRRWGVDPAKMVFTPFYYHLTDEEIEQPPERGAHVFSGGDSLRDYPTLVEAARRLPDVPFRIASARFRPQAPPPNVAAGRVPHEEFVQLIRTASVIAVPLRKGVIRTAGLETFITGMALGKFVITTDSPGIRDYVDHGETGLVVPPGDPTALADAIGWALDPANASDVARIAAAGREAARTRFSPDAYVARLLAVADEVLA